MSGDDLDREELWRGSELEDLVDEAQVMLRNASEAVPKNHVDAPEPHRMKLLADIMRDKLGDDESESFTAEVEVEFSGENKMCIHEELVSGDMPDGRSFRLIQNIGYPGLMVQVDKDADDGSDWDSYTVDPKELTSGLIDAIREFEGEDMDE